MAPGRVGTAASFVILGLVLLAGAWYAYHRIVEVPRTWPGPDALVVSSRVVNPRGPSDYSPEFVFRITEGASARDVRVVASWRSSSYTVVQSHRSRFPQGARITVAVNPADPSDVRYDLTLSWTNLIVPGILGLIGLVFTGAGFFAGRSDEMRTAPVAADRKQTARLVATFFFTLGVVLGTIGLLMARSDFEMVRGWPRVDGRVVRSSVVRVASGGTRRNLSRFDAAVTFRYVVDDRTLESETTYGQRASRPTAEERAATYAPGTVHTIWYRPEDPRLIRFDLDSWFHVFVASGATILMGLLFAGFGMMIRNTTNP